MSKRFLRSSKSFWAPELFGKKFWYPTWSLKNFGTPTTKLKITQKVFVPLLQLYNSFRTPDVERKKLKEFNSFKNKPKTQSSEMHIHLHNM